VGKAKRREERKGRARPRKKRTRPELSDAEREQLKKRTARGRTAARVFKRARILERIDRGFAMQDIPVAVGVGEARVRRVRRRYEQGGWAAALHERPRPGGQPRLNAKQEQRIVARVCGPPPPGRSRWTVRRIAEAGIERGLAAQVGRETIRVVLQSHELKPWREKNVERPGAL
jgi:transposase